MANKIWIQFEVTAYNVDRVIFHLDEVKKMLMLQKELIEQSGKSEYKLELPNSKCDVYIETE